MEYETYNRGAKERKRKYLKKLYYKIKLHRLSKKIIIQISEKTQIGEGFYIVHTGRIIVNSEAIIGKNVNIGKGVTIGLENRGKCKGCPKIGNKVWIEINAVIVGYMDIGDNVLIASNSYVDFDIPDNLIVIGNPETIHQND